MQILKYFEIITFTQDYRYFHRRTKPSQVLVLLRTLFKLVCGIFNASPLAQIPDDRSAKSFSRRQKMTEKRPQVIRTAR